MTSHFHELTLRPRYQSLRVRLLLPLLAVALLASLGVAVASYHVGERWTREEVEIRYQRIAETLSRASFPLYQQVVDPLAEMTRTELISLDAEARVIVASLPIPRGTRITEINASPSETSADRKLTIDGRQYRYGVFERRVFVDDGGRRVAVLFNESEMRASRWRMASLPLLTGLSTVILLTSVTLWFAGRLVQRLSRLQQGVKAIAAGNFETEVPERGNDEVGQLGIAVTQMSRQLSQMRTRLQRQQGEKLLHQLAGGLAHQLRNSLTGARMAIELHGRQCDSQDNSLEIAVSQLEQTEDHVRRLLTVASGRQEDDQPQAVGDCLWEAMKTLTATAKHLKVQVDFQVESNLEPLVVRDGPSLHAAVNNLVLNAFHEGNHVTVSAALQRDEALTHDVETQRLAELLVVDDGPGPPKQVANEIFEPFVTSKPEGLGLGLPLVARTAGRLGGQVSWDRDHGKTRFRMTFQVAQRGL